MGEQRKSSLDVAVLVDLIICLMRALTLTLMAYVIHTFWVPALPKIGFLTAFVLCAMYWACVSFGQILTQGYRLLKNRRDS